MPQPITTVSALFSTMIRRPMAFADEEKTWTEVPLVQAGWAVSVVWACAGSRTDPTTGLLQDSGSDRPAATAPPPATRDFRCSRRE